MYAPLSATIVALCAAPNGLAQDLGKAFHSGDYDQHATVHYDTDPTGALWARGRGYKASADAGGFQFIPFLGSDAPRNYPLHMRLTGARRGGDSVAVTESAKVARHGERITLDRGGVQVRYDLSADGVEQSFSLDSSAGSGDLVLHIDVETELVAADDGEGFTFRRARGGVTYGAAVAFDADGRRTSVDASLLDGNIQLTVPAAFLDGAAWPVVIDPLLTPFTIGATAADLTDPDVAYSPAGGRYCVAFEEAFSAADTDIFTWFVAPDGTISDGGYAEQTAATWSNPRVGMLTGSSDSAYIVAEGESVAVPGSSDIVGRGRTGAGTFYSPMIVASATSAYSCESPDIGTDGFIQQGITHLIAFNRVFPTGRREIHAAITNLVSVFPSRAVAASPAFSTSAPAVSSSSGTCCLSLDYIVGWSQRETASGASSVWTARIDYSNTQAIRRDLVALPNAGAFYFDVDVSASTIGSPGDFGALPYLVTYDDRLAGDADAYVAVCVDGVARNTYELQLSEHADKGPDQNDLVVATGSGRFMLGYEENGELHVTVVESIDGEMAIIERRRVAIGSDLEPGSLSTAGALYSTPGDWDSLFVWSQRGSGPSEISGSFAQSPLGDAAGVQYCYGTANSTGDRGFIQVNGTRLIADPHHLLVEALPAGVFGYFLASRTAGNVVNAGGSQGTLCVGGSVGRFGIYQASADGTASYPLIPGQIAQPQGPVSAVPGERWHLQSWYRDASGGVATSNFTNGAAVRFR